MVKKRRAIAAAPIALRTFIQTLFGERSTITEQDLTPKELELIRNAVAFAESGGKKVIGYGDYGPTDTSQQYSGTGTVLDALTNPGTSLAMTLGMAKFDRNKDGSIIIRDKYRFDAPSSVVRERLADRGLLQSLADGLASNGLLGVGNVIGNIMLPADSKGRDVNIRIPPKITR